MRVSEMESEGTSSSPTPTEQADEAMTNNYCSFEYDEDLSQNPFFQTFLLNYVDLFSQCVVDRWIICVPRKDSLPKSPFSIEDFTAHVLKPWNTCQELQLRSPNIACTSIRNWNFITLTDTKVEILGNTIYVETGDGDSPSPRYVQSIQILFEETFYTPDKKNKYKILCISSPLNSSHNHRESALLSLSALPEEDEPLDPALWTLTSLRDCIDFLWTHGRKKTLETYDSYIRLFLHNHRSLEDLPLPVVRDLVLDLYRRCLTFVRREEKKKNKIKKRSRKSQSVSSTTSTNSSRSSSESSETSHESSISSTITLGALLNYQIATETYVLHGIYRPLMASLTCSLSFEDSNLNKLLRNLSEIHPKDLEIPLELWDNLTRAKNELSRLSLHTTPLAKLGCLAKTMKQINQNGNTQLALGADELLPIWVYVIVKASSQAVDNWIAQLQFLKQFRFSITENNHSDSEGSFLIVTLEASLLFLNSGKIRTLGLADSEKDTGTPCDDYVAEFWLRCLFHCDDDEVEGQLFLAIRQGNLSRLEELIKSYENARINQAMTPQNQPSPSIESKLCHPLCTCSNCQLVISQAATEKQKRNPGKLAPILQKRNEEAGLTLLHVACIYGRPKIVDYLLIQGAGVDVVDNLGLLPIHHAAGRGHQNALLLLLHSGSPIDVPDNSLNTPLHLAAMNGHESCVKALIYYAEHSRKSLNVSHQNSHGDSPLHHAAKFGFIGIVQLLVESGASINITNHRHKTPIDLAHDIHIVRTLQRSLKRRSLVHNNFHGDFVSVDVLRRGEHDAGVVMLISEPHCQSQESPDETETDSQVDVNESKSVDSVPVSASSTLPRVRKLSTVVTPSFSPASSEILANSRKKRNLNNNNEGEETHNHNGSGSGEMRFHVENFLPSTPFLAPEEKFQHLRKISVDSLERSSVPTERQRAISKLFHAIEVGDLPLALFYLGIPVEEIENEVLDENIQSEVHRYLENLLNSPCHPLCPCKKCTSRSQGLLAKYNLDLNSVQNDQGLAPLHSAAKWNMKSLVLILLKYGADPTLRSKGEGKTPLEYAKENYHEGVAKLLQDWKEAIQNYGRQTQ